MIVAVLAGAGLGATAFAIYLAVEHVREKRRPPVSLESLDDTWNRLMSGPRPEALAPRTRHVPGTPPPNPAHGGGLPARPWIFTEGVVFPDD